MSALVVLSEWIAKEPRFVPFSASSAIRGLLAFPIFPFQTFFSEKNSFGSVDWPPIELSLLPKHGNTQKDNNISLRSLVSDVPPRPLLSNLITYL